eukprot:TRINITY_DN2729_c0_g1_i1.p1 TRINITY_DN2729_c0_g1~~TRINITY_DN2729_c0_g1_i1.p1  ORF type:complete len:509 (-),score=137.93 TRINITY_DN2729_c0_g1_i1:8-1534(-)
MSLGNFPQASGLYLRIISTPQEQLPEYMTKYKRLLETRPLVELMTPEEAAQFDKERTERQVKEAGGNPDLPEGGSDEPSRPKNDAEIESEFKARVVIPAREAVHKTAMEEREKRRPLEAGINRRNYFHVKSMDENVLASWRKYLEFEEGEGHSDRIRNLYERSLVPCAHYTEFWVRFAAWLDRAPGSISAIRDLYTKATMVFLRKRPAIYLDWATMEEAHGYVNEARSLFQQVQTFAPEHVETIERFANFERRQGSVQNAIAVYEAALANPALAGDAKAFTFVSVLLARLIAFTQGSQGVSRARAVYEAATQFPLVKNLWSAYATFEASQAGPEGVGLAEGAEDRVKALYERGLAAVTGDDKHALLTEYAEFLADTGSSVSSFQAVQIQLRTEFPPKMFPGAAAAAASTAPDSANRKRPLDNNNEDLSLKLSRTGSDAAAAAAASAAYNSYYGGYGGYGAAGGGAAAAGAGGAGAGYSGYGGYGAYGAPAYGGYYGNQYAAYGYQQQQ